MQRLLRILCIVLLLTSCGVKPGIKSETLNPNIEPSKIAGCTNKKSENYNPNAEVENGECTFNGCTVYDTELKQQYEEYKKEYPAAPLTNTCPAPKKDIFNQSNKPHIGILWVVDNSYSMEEEQKNLGNNFSNFINAFINTRVQFTMGITTTDSKPVSNSLVVLNSEQAQINQAKFVSNFKKMIKVGTNGSSTEKGYQAAYNYLTAYAKQLLPNSDSYLTVIYLSDEKDQSPKNAQYYIDHLRSLVNKPAKVQTHAILDLDNSGGDDDSKGEKYLESVVKTGGIAGDVDEDFAPTLASIGGSIADLINLFVLSTTPFEPSLEVLVNKQVVHNWTYNSAKNAIIFDSPPVFSSEIIINYTPK